MHQRHLLLGVARRDGDDGGSDVRGTVVGTQSTSEQTIAIGHLEDVVLRGAIGSESPTDGLCPHGQVLTGIEYDNGLSRRT